MAEELFWLNENVLNFKDKDKKKKKDKKVKKTLDDVLDHMIEIEDHKHHAVENDGGNPTGSPIAKKKKKLKTKTLDDVLNKIESDTKTKKKKKKKTKGSEGSAGDDVS